MSVRIGAGLSEQPDRASRRSKPPPRRGRRSAERPRSCAGLRRRLLPGRPEATLEGVQEALPGAVVGCGAAGVLGGVREIEEGTAVAVWAATLDGGRARPFHATARPDDDGTIIEGLPAFDGAAGGPALPRPVPSRRTASCATPPHAPRRAAARRAVQRAHDRRLGARCSLATRHGDGAVGAVLEGVELLPCVSQGGAARTRADDHRRRGPRDRRARRAARAAEAARDRRGPERARGAAWSAAGCWSASSSTRPRPTTDAATSSCALLGADPRRGRSPSAPRSARPGRPAARPRRGQRRRGPARGARPAPPCARRPPAGGRWSSPATAGAGMFEACDHDAEALRARARRVPPRGSSRPARSGRSAARASCTGSPRPWRSSPRDERRPRGPAPGRVLLTGATGGLGHAIARAFAARGATLLLTGRRAEVLEPLAAETGGRARLPRHGRPRRAGAADRGRRRRRRARGQRRAAGHGALDGFSVDQVDRTLDVNLRAPIVLTHALAPGCSPAGAATSC